MLFVSLKGKAIALFVLLSVFKTLNDWTATLKGLSKWLLNK